jgi:hypothetical protein
VIRTVEAVRYVVPLREGGSLPAVVEGDDGVLYVMKFIGAGQGRKALVAEWLAGEIGRRLGLAVPELVAMPMRPELGRAEPNPEIRDLLRASSQGINLGMRYLPSAFAYNALLRKRPDPDLASAIVWFDAFVTNVDRTDRNVNMLLWEDRLWLIDHGAALYFHHDWHDYLARSQTPFPFISQHTLLHLASRIPAADAQLQPMLDQRFFEEIVRDIPADWLAGEPAFAHEDDHRAAYVAYLTHRLQAAPVFVEEAIRARSARV